MTGSQPAGPRPIIEATEVSRNFGAFVAVDRMSISVREGEIVGLIGPNGAGKSTFFNLLSGVMRPSRGRVVFDGADITKLSPSKRARLGMLRTFQLSREFSRMTVLENLLVAPQVQLGEDLLPLFTRRREVDEIERRHFDRAKEVLAIAKLEHVENNRASDLSGGQKKLLELARTLMVDSKLILLDEPGAGVNPALMKTLSDMIQMLRNDHGKTFLIVEHDMDLIASLCTSVTVMAEGRTLVSGSFDEIRQNRQVLDAYLGGAA
ncbi:ABC transporter ATP-binding protein [Paralimibaculum aggregatum]|uniref:ABC transporter ATP-binding protein n=1 Tax=Paralimibaculum aggregatum TaxID=3036245 RepID=A0ABQ6LRB1_9RHOB|nr:ABC transporter ATP-binding protein [Limibaculum sp. NKW23]GMG84008.1 ABC transporter ATP-binding protein [Limibaculum sp. NKW23]